MLIQLKQSEIEEAIIGYINTHLMNVDDRNISIAFTAGRKDTGLTADVDIEMVKNKPTRINTSQKEIYVPASVQSNETTIGYLIQESKEVVDVVPTNTNTFSKEVESETILLDKESDSILQEEETESIVITKSSALFG